MSLERSTPEQATPEQATPEQAADRDWQRLDVRMLLVHPVREVTRFLPALIAVFVLGSGGDGENGWWRLLAIVVPVALGLLRYLTTTFRITTERVELRRGLLSRHVLSTRVERVRTVDLTSSPIQRVLGLTTVRIGTGTASSDDSDHLDLDGLPTGRADELRRELLRVADAGTGIGVGVGIGATAADGHDEVSAPPAVAEQPVEIVRFDAAWLRFAPFTSNGLVAAAAVVAGGSQVLNGLDLYDDLDNAHVSLALPLWVVIPLGVVVAALVVAALSVAGYLVTNWAFRLSRHGGSWHLSRGLLTTRQTSIAVERLAGVSIGEGLLLRAARGRRLSAIVTGVDRSDSGSSTLTPPAPRDVVRRVAAAVLGTAAPVEADLVSHGPAARQRRFVRALLPAVVLSVVVVLAVVAGAPGWLVVVVPLVLAAAIGLGIDRNASLGHALADGYLVARSGSLTRARSVLAVDDVIGWNLRATWFQRRVGLTSLVATTAGGSQAVVVHDVPDALAVELADTALPGLVSQFAD